MNYAISALEALWIVQEYRDAYHLLHGYPTVLLNDNKAAVDRATKSEKQLLTMIQDLIND